VGASSQIELLSSAKLRINERLTRCQPEPGAEVLRAAGRDRRLVVTPKQAEILIGGFTGGKTVPEALVRTIAENRCPPLREFYELVVQAHAAGILLTEAESNAEPRTIRWPLRLPPHIVGPLGAMLAAASALIIVLTFSRWRGPGDWIDVVAGWAGACALLSLGQLLGACVIAGCSEVRGARLFWQTRFPHFRIDATEAIMGGRGCEIAVAAVRAAPILVGAAFTAWKLPGWFPAMSGGALYVLAPFGHSAARQWLAARRSVPQYSIRADFFFEPVRIDWWARWGARWRALRVDVGWVGLAWAVVWAAWAIAAFLRCMPKTAATIQAWIKGAPAPVHLGAEYLLVAAIGLGVVVWIGAGLKHLWLKRTWSRPLHGTDTRDEDRPPLIGDRPTMLTQLPLFRGLDPTSLGALAEAMASVECNKGDDIVEEDEAADAFYVIVDGEMEVRKRLPQKRRTARIGWLGAGDCFGEIALLENTTRTATIRATRRTTLLKLGRAEFDRLVVARVGAANIREVLQHARFLARLTFTAGWSFNELVSIARRCRTIRVDANTAVLTKGEENHWFYLIYDGAFEARDGNRVLRRMGPGEYFGEISLLEGWPATATVVSLEESRCLALTRNDFLELFARDFRIGLRMEAQAELRLGAGIFASR
jgi:CRP-like cAMP-binding protein